MTTNTPEIQSLIRATGSFQVTGSINVTGSITAKFDAPYTAGTASFIGLVSSASFTHTYEIINNNGSYTWYKQPWAKWITVIAIGGGGAGGGCSDQAGNQGGRGATTGGGGGSGGSVVVNKFNAIDIASSVTVIVGQGGTGNYNAQGSPGSHSSFGSYLIAWGGAGGPKSRSVQTAVGAIDNTIYTLANAYGIPRLGANGYGSGYGGIGIVIPAAIYANRNADAPPLPMFKPPFSGILTPNPFNVPTAFPAEITTTGGGGGAGMIYDTSVFPPTYIAYAGKGAGGAITAGTETKDNFANPGIIPNSITYQKPAYNNAPFYGTKVGLGGRGGEYANFQVVAPEPGGLYGGGGGGASPNPNTQFEYTKGATGGNGVVIIISEA